MPPTTMTARPRRTRWRSSVGNVTSGCASCCATCSTGVTTTVPSRPAWPPPNATGCRRPTAPWVPSRRGSCRSTARTRRWCWSSTRWTVRWPTCPGTGGTRPHWTACSACCAPRARTCPSAWSPTAAGGRSSAHPWARPAPGASSTRRCGSTPPRSVTRSPRSCPCPHWPATRRRSACRRCSPTRRWPPRRSPRHWAPRYATPWNCWSRRSATSRHRRAPRDCPTRCRPTGRRFTRPR